MKIGFRNPVKFINQWKWFKWQYKVRAVLIWILYAYIRNDCNVWIKRGIRVLGIEIEHTQHLI